jgi:hypothetical protein
MLTLSIVIEDRDEYGDLRAYHKHEVSDPRAIVQFCNYLVRTPDCGDDDTANAAGRLLDLHSEAYEEFKRDTEEWLRIMEARHQVQIQGEAVRLPNHLSDT